MKSNTPSANPVTWSAESQRARRNELYRLHCDLLRRVFLPDGRPRPGVSADCGDPRVTAWHAFAAFAGTPGDVRLGNAILRHTSFLPGYDFFMSALVQLHARYRARFEPDILKKAEACMAASGDEQAASCGFVGMNDNFPAMASIVLVLVGEATRRPALVRNGIAKMRGIVGRLDTHGTVAEFNSPTYSGLTLACMADIATYARSAEARRLALRIEQQVWFDICARFHGGSSQMGGPTSRSYMADSCGHMHNGRFVLHAAFGPEAAFLSPVRYVYGEDRRLIIHHGNIPFIAANGIWLASAEFHPPAKAAAWMVRRPDPFTVSGTAACALVWRPDDWRHGSKGPERERFRSFETYRYAPVLMTTHHTAEYSLGTSSGAHACGSGGQHDAVFATWRRRRPARGQVLDMADVRTVFARYCFNEAQPSSESSLLVDEGRKTCVQKGGTALVLYRPGIGRIADITSMRVAVVLPLHCSRPDEVWLGRQRLAGLSGRAGEPETVFIRDGSTFLALRPLELTDYGRRSAVTVRRVEKFLVISFYNYEGPARSLNFPYQAALFTQNGFAIEVASADEGVGFAAFRRRVEAATLQDTIVDGVRVAEYRRKGVNLRIAYDPTDEGVVPPAWIDGKPRNVPRFQATGLARLPW